MWYKSRLIQLKKIKTINKLLLIDSTPQKKCKQHVQISVFKTSTTERYSPSTYKMSHETPNNAQKFVQWQHQLYPWFSTSVLPKVTGQKHHLRVIWFVIGG